MGDVTVVTRQARRRWLLVAAAVALLCALPAVRAALPVTGVAVGADELRQRMLVSGSQPYQGYAETSAQLGLPDLPQLSDVTSLLTGTTHVRTWYAGPQRWRTDVISGAGQERDVYQTAEGQFIWDYGANLLTELVGSAPVRLPRAADLLPPELARRALGAGPGDQVSSLPARRVAGIAAAGLRLVPTDPATSIGAVDVWADPVTGLPLRVAVTARGADAPVLVSQFLDLALTTPAETVLTPARAPGAGFTSTRVADILTALGRIDPGALPARLVGRPRTPVPVDFAGIGGYGQGLSTFVVLPLPRSLGEPALDGARTAGGVELTFARGSGVLITTPLLSVLVERSDSARRTYLLAGLVDPAVLQQAAAELSTTVRSRP